LFDVLATRRADADMCEASFGALKSILPEDTIKVKADKLTEAAGGTIKSIVDIMVTNKDDRACQHTATTVLLEFSTQSLVGHLLDHNLPVGVVTKYTKLSEVAGARKKSIAAENGEITGTEVSSYQTSLVDTGAVQAVIDAIHTHALSDKNIASSSSSDDSDSSKDRTENTVARRRVSQDRNDPGHLAVKNAEEEVEEVRLSPAQDVLLDGMLFLASIVWDDSIATDDLKQKLFVIVAKCFRLFSFIPGLSTPALSLLLVLLSNTTNGVEQYVKTGGVSQILQTMEMCDNEGEAYVLAFFGACMERVVANEEIGRPKFLQLYGTATALKMLTFVVQEIEGKVVSQASCGAEYDFVFSCLDALAIVAAEEESALEIGHDGINVLAELVRMLVIEDQNPACDSATRIALMTSVVQLQALLAAQHQNIVLLVQYNGLEGLLKMLGKTAETITHRPLVFTSVQLMDTIFMDEGGEEYGGIAWELGAEKILPKISTHKSYKKDAEMQEAVRSTRLQLDKTSGRKKLSVAERNEAESKVKTAAKKRAAQQRMAERKKKVAEVGRAQQAKMMKMISMRSSMKPGERESGDSTELVGEGGKSKTGLKGLLSYASNSVSGLRKKSGVGLDAQGAKTSTFESANPSAEGTDEKEDGEAEKGKKKGGFFGFGKKK